MEHVQTNGTQNEPETGAAPKPPERRRARRWILVGVLLLIGVILLLLPTLLSCPLGRPLLVGYADQQLNGRVEIRDCSLGWFGGLRIDGLVVFDAADRQILQASHVTSGLRFMDLLKSNFRFRQVRAKDLDLLLSRGADGSLNWEHLVRADSNWRTAAARQEVGGELFVSNGSATYEDETGQPPVFLRLATAYLKLTPDDGAMTAKLGAAAQIGTRTSGQILWDGSVRPVREGSPDVSEQLITRGLDPAAVGQRLGPTWTLVTGSDHEARFVRRCGATFRSAAASQPGHTDDLVHPPTTR